MKKILQLSLVFLFAVFSAQSVSDYAYVYIPQKFKDFKENQYEFNNLLSSKLKQKNFTIIKENIHDQNPCEVLTAEVLNSSNMFKNKVTVQFTDCHNKTIASFEGKSNIKDFESGMQDALGKAVGTIPVSNPIKKNVEISSPKSVEHQTIVSEKDLQLGNNVETYSSGSLILNRIFLSEGQFILVNPNSSAAYATFKESTKRGVYRVLLSNGTQTLGYTEDGKIVVELPDSDGNFRKEIFERKRN